MLNYVTGGKMVIVQSSDEHVEKELDKACQQMEEEGIWTWKKQYLANYRENAKTVAYIMTII